jgi:hypothetical protein
MNNVPRPVTQKRNNVMTKRPAHRLKTAENFAIVQIERLRALPVRLHHEPLPESDEDDWETPLNTYSFSWLGEDRKISFRGLDLYWKDRKNGPSGVDWGQIKLQFIPLEVYTKKLRMARVGFRLEGLEQVDGLIDHAPKLWSKLFVDYPNEALFDTSSDVTAEFKRRRSIENATKKIASVKKTLKRKLALPPFVPD